MSQHLCLICCYSFPAKRARFISDEAQESFRTFCGDLGLSIDNVSKNRKKDPSCDLDLPYGENITVCGDCLGIIIFYVQKRTIQRGKEEKLMELQKAVCAALKDLQEIVEEVQVKIDQLHDTVRMGDESCLNSFCRRTSNKENDPRMFREKVLKLSTGFIKRNNAPQNLDGHGRVPINIKVEPRDEEEVGDTINGYVARDGDTLPPSPECLGDGFPSSDSNSAASNFSDKMITKRRKRNRKPHAATFKSPKIIKCSTIQLDSQFNFEEEFRQTASRWKDDLIGRILMQMNNDLQEDMKSYPQADKSMISDEACDNFENTIVSNSFQYKDGKLKLNGIDVIIREEHQALKCTKCGKGYFEERDATMGMQLETLMRDHILSAHKTFQASEVPKRKYVKQDWEEVPSIPEAEIERDFRIRRNQQKYQSMEATMYYCRYGNSRRACPVLLKKLVYQNGDVVFMKTTNEHENHRNYYLGLTPEQKRFVKELYLNENALKPGEIIRRFVKEGKPEPDRNKLNTYLKTLKRSTVEVSKTELLV